MHAAYPGDRRPRLIGWGDGLLLGALAAGMLWIVWRSTETLHYHWNWGLIPSFVLRFDAGQQAWVPNLLLTGLLTTVRLVLWTALLALPVGLVVALCRSSGDPLLRLAGRLYVELVRNTPVLVLLLVLYFFVSGSLVARLGLDDWLRSLPAGVQALLGWVAAPGAFLPAFLSGVVCLALYQGAFVGEIIRAGIAGVGSGQWEAAQSLGLGRWPTLRRVVLPQAVARMLPPLAGQLIALTKDSAIVSIVSIQDLTFMANEVAVSSGRVFETWLTAASAYFVLCSLLSHAFRRLELAQAARWR